MTASPLIFHRNVAWYCCEYHERNTINLSLFIQQMIQNSRRDISSRRLPFLLLSKLLCDNISNQLRQLCMLRRSQVNKITAVLRRDL